MSRMTVAFPVMLLAVTVYGVEAEIAVGVPVTTPVAMLKESPNGSAGITA